MAKRKPLHGVAIIGPGAPRGAGALYDKRWELWGLNSSYRQQPKATPWARMFNLHRYAHLERDVPQYVDWDSAHSRRHPKLPFVVLDSWGRLLTTHTMLPRRELEAMPRGRYHASSFDWMVAYAILCGARHIHVHGAHFALDSPREEPISARACLEYWIGYAQGLGIEVRAHSCHGLFRQFHLVMSDTMYGYDDVVMVEDRSR